VATRRRGWDNLTKRCPCRDQATCKHAWLLRIEHNGREVAGPIWKLAGLPRHTRLSVDEAKSYRDAIRSQVFAGTFQSAVPAASTAASLTVTEVAAAWVAARRADASRRPHRHDILEASMAAILRTEIVISPTTAPVAFGELLFVDVRRFHVDAYREARRRKFRATEAKLAKMKAGSGRTPERPLTQRGEVGINRHLGQLRTFFNWSIEHDYRTDSPFQHNGRPVLKLTKERSRSRVLTPDEERRLHLASGTHLRDCIVAALETGCRVGELLSLTWADVEQEDGQPAWLALKGERTKTGQARVVPVTATLATVLATRRQDPNGEPHRPEAFVFGNAVGEQIGTIATAFRSACRRAGVDGLRFHDLRRTAGSRFLQYGVPLHDVRDQLGHASVAQTDTYLNGTRDSRRDAVLRAEQRRLGKVAVG
jgi:integrase